MRSTSNWSYAKQEFSLNEIEPDCDAYCGDCGVYVDWDWYKDGNYESHEPIEPDE
jgi:hypothetical protein